MRTPQEVARDTSFQAAQAASAARASATHAHTAEVSAQRALESVDTLRGEVVAAVSRLARPAAEHDGRLTSIEQTLTDHGARLSSIEGDAAEAAKWLRRIGQVLLAVTGLGAPGGAVAAWHWSGSLKSEAIAQSRASAQSAVQESTDERLRRLFAEARAEGRAERDSELEAARVAELRRQVAAERAASMRDSK